MPSMRVLGAGLTAFVCLSTSNAEATGGNDLQVAVQPPKPAQEVTDVLDSRPDCVEGENLHEIDSAYNHIRKASADLTFVPGTHGDLAKRQLDNLTASASISVSVPTIIGGGGPTVTVVEPSTFVPTITVDPPTTNVPPPVTTTPTSTPQEPPPTSNNPPSDAQPSSQPLPTTPNPPTSTDDSTGNQLPVPTTSDSNGSGETAGTTTTPLPTQDTPVATSSSVAPPAPVTSEGPTTSANNVAPVTSSTTQQPSAGPSSSSVVETGSFAGIGGFPTDSTSPSPTATPTSSSSRNGNTITTTDQFGNEVVLSGATDGMVFTTTDSEGRVVTITYNPRGKPISRTELLTSTLANGDQQTLTSVAIITPTAASGDEGSNTAATSTTEGDASLVTGNAAPEQRRLGREALALVAGAAGAAWLL